MSMTCPNCHSEDNPLLYSHEDHGILHCGCYYAGGGMWTFPEMFDVDFEGENMKGDLAVQPVEAPAAQHSSEAEADRLALDAARYRWLRRCRGQEHDPLFTVQHELDGILWGGDLDAAIDAAMGAKGQPAVRRPI